MRQTSARDPGQLGPGTPMQLMVLDYDDEKQSPFRRCVPDRCFPVDLLN